MKNLLSRNNKSRRAFELLFDNRPVTRPVLKASWTGSGLYTTIIFLTAAPAQGSWQHHLLQ